MTAVTGDCCRQCTNLGVDSVECHFFFNRESDVFVTIRRCSCCYRVWKHILLDRLERRENGGGSGNKSERASTEPVARGYPRAVAEVIGDDDARRRRREPLTCWGPPWSSPVFRPVLPRGEEGERSLNCGGAGGHQTGARFWGRYKGQGSLVQSQLIKNQGRRERKEARRCLVISVLSPLRPHSRVSTFDSSIVCWKNQSKMVFYPPPWVPKLPFGMFFLNAECGGLEADDTVEL